MSIQQKMERWIKIKASNMIWHLWMRHSNLTVHLLFLQVNWVMIFEKDFIFIFLKRKIESVAEAKNWVLWKEALRRIDHINNPETLMNMLSAKQEFWLLTKSDSHFLNKIIHLFNWYWQIIFIYTSCLHQSFRNTLQYKDYHLYLSRHE